MSIILVKVYKIKLYNSIHTVDQQFVINTISWTFNTIPFCKTILKSLNSKLVSNTRMQDGNAVVYVKLLIHHVIARVLPFKLCFVLYSPPSQYCSSTSQTVWKTRKRRIYIFQDYSVQVTPRNSILKKCVYFILHVSNEYRLN